jgi:hypothetical protein
MTPRDHRFQNLLADLRRQIALSVAPGQVLPPKRELAFLHGVSPSSVQRALATLVDDGSVLVRPRIGWIRAPDHGSASAAHTSTEKSPLRIGILSPRGHDEWEDHEQYPALIAEIKRRGFTVVEAPNRFQGSRRSTPGRRRIELSRVPWNMFDIGLLVDAEDTLNSPATAAALRGRPVISVDLDATTKGIDSVVFTDAEAGALAARHLLQLGHRRFALSEEANVEGFAWDPAWTRRRHGFEAAVGEAGGVCLASWRLGVCRQGGRLRMNQFLQHDLPAVLNGWNSSRRDRPTALFALYPSLIGHVAHELSKLGWRVPQDMSIVTVTWNQQVHPSGELLIDGLRCTAIDFDLQTLVRRTLDCAEELAAELSASDPKAPARAPRLFTAPASLLAGDSTAPAPKLPN